MILNGYGKGKVERAFAKAHPGCALRIGKLDYSMGADLLVANDVAEPGSGFGTSTNRVTIFAADGGVDALPLLPKRSVADRILDRVVTLLDARDAPVQTGATVTPGRTTP